jgi:hypothetical protein
MTEAGRIVFGGITAEEIANGVRAEVMAVIANGFLERVLAAEDDSDDRRIALGSLELVLKYYNLDDHRRLARARHILGQSVQNSVGLFLPPGS